MVMANAARIRDLVFIVPSLVSRVCPLRLPPSFTGLDTIGYAQVPVASRLTGLTARRCVLHDPVGCPDLATSHLPRLSKRDAGQARARYRRIRPRAARRD